MSTLIYAFEYTETYRRVYSNTTMSILKHDDKYTHSTYLSILILCLSSASSMTHTCRSNSNRLRGRQPSPAMPSSYPWALPRAGHSSRSADALAATAGRMVCRETLCLECCRRQRRVFAGLFTALPQDVLRTLTSDNGKEFALFRSLKGANPTPLLTRVADYVIIRDDVLDMVSFQTCKVVSASFVRPCGLAREWRERGYLQQL